MEIEMKNIQTNKDEIISPIWHKDILLERKKSIEEGKTKYITLDQLKKKYSRLRII